MVENLLLAALCPDSGCLGTGYPMKHPNRNLDKWNISERSAWIEIFSVPYKFLSDHNHVPICTQRFFMVNFKNLMGTRVPLMSTRGITKI